MARSEGLLPPWPMVSGLNWRRGCPDCLCPSLSLNPTRDPLNTVKDLVSMEEVPNDGYGSIPSAPEAWIQKLLGLSNVSGEQADKAKLVFQRPIWATRSHPGAQGRHLIAIAMGPMPYFPGVWGRWQSILERMRSEVGQLQ